MTKILKVVGASWLRTKISSYILGIIGVLAILALFVGQFERIQEDGNYAATVFYSNKTGYRIEYWGQSNELTDIPRGVARAHFRMDIDTIGWSLLEVETDASYPDEIQAYAAGIVEGALTWYLIHTHLENTIRAKCEDQPMEKQCDKLRDALDRSVNIWKTKAAEQAVEPFWHHVSLHYTQISGIYTGWKHGVERSMKEYETDISDLYWLNAVAEVVEIQHKMNLTLDDPALDVVSGLSSAFLRIVNETNDDGTARKLYVAHNSAGSYSSMTRILKRYKLKYHLTSRSSELVPGTSVDFSGYPGSITSQDEFYTIQGIGHNMAVTGTSLNNYNRHLWKDVNITEQVPTAPRVSTANRLASDPNAWARILAASNSGTACKQWLVVDFNKLGHMDDSAIVKKADRNDFVPASGLDKDVRHIMRNGTGHNKGLLRLIEQIPGRTHSADLTDALLEQGFWATYGLPFFVDIATHTHVNQMEEKYGEIFSESQSPRAVIFKRGYKNATSLDSIIALMRQNNVTAMNRASNETVECSENVSCILNDIGYWSVLGVRGDIAQYKEPYGVIDTKVVAGQANQQTLEFIAISSPPYSNTTTNKTIPLNKGTVATIYTDQFDDEPTINGPEIRDLVKKQQEEEAQETLELLNRDVVKPFQWSESEFQYEAHEGLPDTWNFGSFTPVWSCGIYTGWKHGVERSMKEYETDISDLYWLNAVAEVVEIQHKMNLTLDDPALDVVSGLSSAFLRIVNETNDDGTARKLYVAHNSAGSYSSMTRILKRYKLKYHLTSRSSELVPGTSVDFSGYPGSITSQDEFYTIQGIGHNMAVTGTSLNNYNRHLWKDVNITEQVPTAPRVSTANRLASDPNAWARILAASNSGTACKQWLVVDFNKLGHMDDSAIVKKADRNDFVPASGLDKDVRHIMRNGTGHNKGLLRLIEQIPGRTHSADLTDALLEQGFWATYGLPFFVDIATHTHVNQMEEKYGEIFSESQSPRAVIFKRGYKNATSLDSIIALMRQNNVTAMNRASNETVECSENVSCILNDIGYWSVLGVRGDIAQYKEPYGVIDTKVVAGQANQQTLEFIAISSPPYSNTTTNKTIPLNKGTVATIYTDQFDDEPTINGPEIRDLVKKQQEEEAQETLELLNRDVVKPFQWSESEFQYEAHEGLPDTWNFGSFTPVWSW